MSYLDLPRRGFLRVAVAACAFATVSSSEASAGARDRRPGPGAAVAGTLRLGGDLPIARMGFGAMRITGEGIWGEPADARTCRAVLRRALELG